jgi:hypothetical protein
MFDPACDNATCHSTPKPNDFENTNYQLTPPSDVPAVVTGQGDDIARGIPPPLPEDESPVVRQLRLLTEADESLSSQFASFLRSKRDRNATDAAVVQSYRFAVQFSEQWFHKKIEIGVSIVTFYSLVVAYVGAGGERIGTKSRHSCGSSLFQVLVYTGAASSRAC